MTSTMALTNATLPYVIKIANRGFPAIANEDVEIAKGVNIVKGNVTHSAVADAFELEFTPLANAL